MRFCSFYIYYITIFSKIQQFPAIKMKILQKNIIFTLPFLFYICYNAIVIKYFK